MDQERTKDPAKVGRKRRWVAIGLIIFIIAAIIHYEGRFRALQTSVPSGGNLFIFFLVNLNIVILTLLLFLLARNVFKLFYEGKRFFGVHLRAKLVAIFLGFSLIPTLLFFFAARGVIEQNLDFWFQLEVEKSVQGALEISRDYYATLGERSRFLAQAVARRLGDVLPEEESLENLRQEYGLAQLELFDGQGTALVRVQDPEVVTIPTPGTSDLVVNALMGRVVDRARNAPRGQLLTAAVPVAFRDGPAALVVSLHVPRDIGARAEELRKTFAGYSEMKALRRPIKTTSIVYLLILTILILFSATWLGFWLAREITVPIGRLAEGAGKVAAGDFSSRVEVEAHDEVGDLVKAFNRMTDHLQTSEARLQEAHRDLALAYQENEERRRMMETVLRSVGTGVVSLDPQGRITTFNRAAERMFGVKAEDIVGRSYASVLSAEHLPLFKGMLDELAGSGKRSLRREFPVVVRGTPMVLLLGAGLLEDALGAPMGTVLVVEDLTKLVSAQKEAAWSEVASRVAHEIKNPLTPIRLFAERLKKRLTPALGEQDAALLEEATGSIIRESEGLRRLVDEFSRFSRLPGLQPVLGDINQTVREAASLLSGRKTLKGGVRLDLDETVPQVSHDRGQVKRALHNLLENAARAVEEGGGGGITVSTRLLSPEGMLAVEVEDDGPGVPLKAREKIFQPYFSAREGGTGLGLAITQRIAEEHGGKVSYEPRHPRGSRFTLKLPVDIERRRPDRRPQGGPGPGDEGPGGKGGVA